MLLSKNRGVFASLCLWSILFLSVNAKTKKKDETQSMNDIYRGRCASRCLSLHSTRIATLSKQSQVENNGSLGWCQNHKQCAKCLEPCKASWDLKRSQCRELCARSIPKKHWECVTSCEFLRSVVAVKQGDCPAPEKASGFAAACVEGCEEDSECPAKKKCCSNGCGHTCQPPKNLYKGAPLKPRKELSFEELRSGQMEVSWSSRFNVSAEPVIYVVQRRWNYGIQPSEDAATQWEVVAQTTEVKARLADIRAGRWYQFRVAAVNVHGTRGFTTPSRHIHTKKDPSSPPTPSELRVSNVTFGPGGRAVSVRLHWSIPSDLDVPVHHYKVSWSWATGSTGATARPKTKRRKMVNGGQRYVELESLRANRSYSVELQAVSYWGQNPLKSPKASLHFTTRPNPTVVRYRVQWVPDYCGHNQTKGVDKIITQEGFASLPGLLFSCKYSVNLQPLGTKGRAQAETTFFFTPSCATISAKSPKHIACPGQEENLTASFMADKGNITAVFTWEVSTPLPPQQLHGFQERNVLVVSGLQLATPYRLEIQVIGAGGEGPATTKTFYTPNTSPVLQHRRERESEREMM
ncbi:unnamed protein product, partial [Coregonus sp. 'balchen']